MGLLIFILNKAAYEQFYLSMALRIELPLILVTDSHINSLFRWHLLTPGGLIHSPTRRATPTWKRSVLHMFLLNEDLWYASHLPRQILLDQLITRGGSDRVGYT